MLSLNLGMHSSRYDAFCTHQFGEKCKQLFSKTPHKQHIPWAHMTTPLLMQQSVQQQTMPTDQKGEELVIGARYKVLTPSKHTGDTGTIKKFTYISNQSIVALYGYCKPMLICTTGILINLSVLIYIKMEYF